MGQSDASLGRQESESAPLRMWASAGAWGGGHREHPREHTVHHTKLDALPSGKRSGSAGAVSARFGVPGSAWHFTSCIRKAAPLTSIPF